MAEQDPFLDDQFAPLDTRRSDGTFAEHLSQLAEEHPEFAPTPEEVAEVEEVEETPAPVAAAPAAPAPENEQPEVIENQDGSSITIEHTNRGWRATLDSGVEGVNPEVFYGKTKQEMWTNIAAGKIKATTKIRELNRKVKLGEAVAPEPAPAPTPTRQLSAEDIFQIKTELAANPEKALDLYFQKKTGMSVEELTQLAREGKEARTELNMEAVSKAFLEANPDYFNHDQNYFALVGWLMKNKLGKSLGKTAEALDAALAELNNRRIWTVKNLTEAYDELLEAGLLLTKPEAEEEEEPEPIVLTRKPAKVVAQPQPETPAVETPQDPRIARVTRRTRAGSVGLRETDSSVRHTPQPQKPPSDEELENLSDGDIAKLFADVRKAKATRR